MDRIIIEDLLLRCIVGVNPDERTKEQDVNLRVTLCVDLRPAGSSDDLAHTVDYKALKGDIRALVEGSRFFLIERLAHEIARLCLQRPRVEGALVRLEKPGALRFARTVAVEIERTRADYPEFGDPSTSQKNRAPHDSVSGPPWKPGSPHPGRGIRRCRVPPGQAAGHAEPPR